MGWRLAAGGGRRSFLIAAGLLAACSSDLEKQSQIVKLRVLAVQAEPAELIFASGQPPPKTTLTALAVEPANAPIAMQYALCTVQDAVPSPMLDCPGTQGIPLPSAGPVSAVLDLSDPQIAALALQLLQGSDGGTADAGALLDQGIQVLVGFRATAPAHGLPDGGPPGENGGDVQLFRGLTTVPLRSAGAPINHNPSIDRLDIGDGRLLLAPDGTPIVPQRPNQRLTPIPASDAKDPVDGGVESLGYSFFATAGELSSLRSTDKTATGQLADTFVDWTAPDAGPDVQFWVVVRDGRGGAGWLHRSVHLQ